jgi:hypothetical protein
LRAVNRCVRIVNLPYAFLGDPLLSQCRGAGLPILYLIALKSFADQSKELMILRRVICMHTVCSVITHCVLLLSERWGELVFLS